MYYGYVLRSLRFEGKLYIGYTSDLKKGLYEHNAGKTHTTRRMRPLELVYYEAYRARTDAKRRERIEAAHRDWFRQVPVPVVGSVCHYEPAEGGRSNLKQHSVSSVCDSGRVCIEVCLQE